MITCGVKLTHDGGVALVDNGRLIFSIEMEKLNDAERHSKITDLGQVFDILADNGYDSRDVDKFVFDGWRRTFKTSRLFHEEVEVNLAPYRRGILGNNPLQEYRFKVWDLPYSSFCHYSGHLLGSYCASPFAAAGKPSWIIVWDGAMFPCLYYADPAANNVQSISTICPLIGNAYHEMALRVPPFDTGIQFPDTLAVPGKIMALIARGQVDERLLARCDDAYKRVCALVIDSRRSHDDFYWQEPLGHQLLQQLLSRIDFHDIAPEDVLATWHEFIWRTFHAALAALLKQQTRQCGDLVFCGGCALNIKWNRRLRTCGLFDSVWVPPFPNDSGAALGAAVCGWVADGGLAPLEWSVYSGPELVLKGPPPGWSGASCAIAEVADLLHLTGEPVVILNGRAELGPRALGNRSIIAPATSTAMKSHLNVIKRREGYRPVAPICIEDLAAEFFLIDRPDPYMSFEWDVQPGWKNRIPAVLHEDGTARVQTVNKRQNSTISDLLHRYSAISGLAVLCNTSANSAGRGFFASDESAMRWGGTNYVWAGGIMFSRKNRIAFPELEKRDGILAADECVDESWVKA
ncbi:carbamoyltransferase N-terminal domain-containing protein [Bradyrhizobium sp. CB1717]|uniref:carbamoyltransferase N-terminal domain-containing protein n=1 Tax=Bradyrhizobium sp. CB1717 TaxID=3039154 RepID=UPI0024B16111|nr:carbamoyltransferase N-terminal domain-containing protein [Bradyrhizobium sp. CB1717]WFU25159.1 carbamoyltransferase N-terminal domain-containing protein [Bradyrhizobium sp. CB1717]